MRILLPKPPIQSMRVQWWVLSVQTHKQPYIGRVIDILIHLRWFCVQIRRRATVDHIFTGPHFVRPTRYRERYIMHPDGGSARRLVCEECGAEYPFPAGPRGYPCAFCAVERESKVRLWWKKVPIVFEGDIMYRRMREWPKPVPVPAVTQPLAGPMQRPL